MLLGTTTGLNLGINRTAFLVIVTSTNQRKLNYHNFMLKTQISYCDITDDSLTGPVRHPTVKSKTGPVIHLSTINVNLQFEMKAAHNFRIRIVRITDGFKYILQVSS